MIKKVIAIIMAILVNRVFMVKIKSKMKIKKVLKKIKELKNFEGFKLVSKKIKVENCRSRKWEWLGRWVEVKAALLVIKNNALKKFET
jgi:hypothetical protein